MGPRHPDTGLPPMTTAALAGTLAFAAVALAAAAVFLRAAAKQRGVDPPTRRAVRRAGGLRRRHQCRLGHGAGRNAPAVDRFGGHLRATGGHAARRDGPDLVCASRRATAPVARGSRHTHGAARMVINYGTEEGSTHRAQLPAPWPDETLSSLLARFHRLAANRSGAYSLRQLMGSSHYVTAGPLPSGLSALSARAGIPGVLTAADIAERLTLAPYHRPFLSESAAERMNRAMLGSGRSLAMAVGQPRAGVTRPPRQRYCVDCAAVDRLEYGCPYWHRAHQISGVIVCPEHTDQALRTLPERLDSEGRHALYLPDDCPSDTTPSAAPFGASAARVAQISRRLLQANLPALGWRRLAEVYRRRLAELGLLTEAGRVRQTLVHAEFSAMYSGLRQHPAYADLSLGSKMNSVHSDWLAAVLRPPRVGHGPSKHVLVIAFLYETYEQFLLALGRHELPQCTPQANPLPPDQSCSDAALASSIRTEKLSLRSASERLGVSVTTARVRAEALGLRVSRRRKSTSPALEARVRKAFRRGSTSTVIAVALGLSVSTVSRIVRSERGLRERVERAREARRRAARRRSVRLYLATHPEATAVNLQRDRRGLYTYLYRHDRQWLRACFAGRQGQKGRTPQADWLTRDQAIARALQAAAIQIRALPGKPVRCSRSRLLRVAGATNTMRQAANRLLMSRAALNDCAETIEQYRVRRIWWAASQLRAQSQPQAAWRLRRLAGLPDRTSARVVEALTAACSSAPGQAASTEITPFPGP